MGTLGCPLNVLHDELLEFVSGDVFLGTDLQPGAKPAQQALYREMRSQGVDIKFIASDLLPDLEPMHLLCVVATRMLYG